MPHERTRPAPCWQGDGGLAWRWALGMRLSAGVVMCSDRAAITLPALETLGFYARAQNSPQAMNTLGIQENGWHP